MKNLSFIAALLLLALSGAAMAKEAAPMAADPVLEARVNAISAELRCLVCQNQTIADSHAELAIDLKNQVREMVAAGKTDKEIVDYMVQRYGDFVRYRPPIDNRTMLLWFGPAVLFVVGLALLAFNLVRRRRQAAAEATLSAEERQRIEQLLRQGEEAPR